VRAGRSSPSPPHSSVPPRFSSAVPRPTCPARGRDRGGRRRCDPQSVVPAGRRARAGAAAPQPNLFGWAFCAVGLCFEANLCARAYSIHPAFTDPGSLRGGRLMSLVGDMLFAPRPVILVVFVPLLFPTGRPPTRARGPSVLTQRLPSRSRRSRSRSGQACRRGRPISGPQPAGDHRSRCRRRRRT
jgi:hypothetical protein